MFDHFEAIGDGPAPAVPILARTAPGAGVTRLWIWDFATTEGGAVMAVGYSRDSGLDLEQGEELWPPGDTTGSFGPWMTTATPVLKMHGGRVRRESPSTIVAVGLADESRLSVERWDGASWSATAGIPDVKGHDGTETGYGRTTGGDEWLLEDGVVMTLHRGARDWREVPTPNALGVASSLRVAGDDLWIEMRPEPWHDGPVDLVTTHVVNAEPFTD
jgi:hypothetical protein